MRFFLITALLLTGLLAFPAAAQTQSLSQSPRDYIALGTRESKPAASPPREVVAYIDKSDQLMSVYVNGWKRYTWSVSTARRGKITPNGSYTAYLLSRYHKSSLYNDAPMPYSIFFHSHYAIHGTDQISRLGRPASAGCVRLHPDNARILFGLTQQVGLEHMKVVIRD
ncbi:MAG: L,D-transpeptidase [Rhodobacteraceae bacterium]|nr:L,D-transpeptidase [Paracoccaceae bacterium]